MMFSVLRLRHRGRVLPRREWQRRAPLVGDLRVEQLYDDDLLRHLRLARLVHATRDAGPEALPALYDPVLVAMSPQAFTLAGFERIEGADYAQSWLVGPAVSPPGRPKGEYRSAQREGNPVSPPGRPKGAVAQ